MEEAVATRTLYITAEHRQYNRGLIYLRGRRKLLPYSAYIALVALAAARKREPGADGGWVSSWAMAGTLKSGEVAAGQLRKILKVRIEFRKSWRRLGLSPEEIDLDVEGLKRDYDDRIARLFE
jgi:hypothetical protein